MATDQKIEDLLNLALDATEREREKSLELDVGYNPVDRTWDVIVKYTGSLADLERRLNERLGIEGEGGASPIRVVELLNEYAILTLPESLIDYMASSPEIEYVEKPKRLFFSVDQGRAASCVSPLQTAEFNLKGEGVIVAVIDSGVDYAHPDFCNEDGSTRILAIWDQGARAKTPQAAGPPRGFRIGVEYSQEMINEALAAPTDQERYQLVPERDLSGHGTAVLGIAAGNGRGSGGQYRGVAPESDILMVKLGLSEEGGFPRTTELMQAIDYVVRKSLEYQKPVAINLSFGNVYGSHEPYN